eukprot:1738728-Rhodomonas_salina.2
MPDDLSPPLTVQLARFEKSAPDIAECARRSERYLMPESMPSTTVRQRKVREVMAGGKRIWYSCVRTAHRIPRAGVARALDLIHRHFPDRPPADVLQTRKTSALVAREWNGKGVDGV